MPKRLTKAQVIAIAKSELDAAWTAHNENTSAARTTRLRSAKGRAERWLRRREVTPQEAREIMATAPPDPIYGEIS